MAITKTVPTHSPRISEIDLIRSITRECFSDFVHEFWSDFIAERLIWNWHMQIMCDELQELAERVFLGKPRTHDLIINIPPGSSKSSVGSEMFPAWVWTRMPHARFIGGSYSASVALDLALKHRDLVRTDKYMACFEDVELREDQMAKSYFRTTKGGSRYSVGVGGSVTGMHGHFLIVDDPIDPRQSISEVILKSANRWMNETLPTRKVDKDLAPTVLIMQRLAQDDPTQNMIDKALEDRPVRLIKVPGEINTKAAVKPSHLSVYYKNGLMDPLRLSDRTLKEYRKALGPYGYAGQILQEPIPREGAMFKVERISIDVPPPRSQFVKIVRYWDKAATAGAGCFTAGVLIGVERTTGADRFWILHVCRGQWGVHERNAHMKQMAILDGRGVEVWVEQEPGSGGKESALATIQMLAGWRVKADKVGATEGNKARRAEPLADQVAGRNVNMALGEWNNDCIDELKWFRADGTGSKYKDQVDACSGGFNKISRPVIFAGGWKL